MKRMLLPIIKKYFKLLFSIMIVSAMGCGIMTGLSSAYVSLEGSLNDYVKNYKYPNGVITTDVTSRKQIEKLKELPTVSEVNARLCGDTCIKSKEGRYLSVRVFSYNPDDMQKFHFWSQADSRGKDDVLIECNFAEDNGIKAGDTVSFKVDKEYREYFVSGIVSMPETISVQPTEDSWGVNTDFGYAYAPVRLLENEYEKKYSEVKKELDGKQSELDTEWEKAQKELDEAEEKLNNAKTQLSEKEKLFEDSAGEAEEKLAQLIATETELKETKIKLEIQKKGLTAARKSVQSSLEEFEKNKDKLFTAADGLEKIDDALKNIENMNAVMTKSECVKFLGILKAFPDTELSYIFNVSESLLGFVDTARNYGLSYDATDKVTDFSKKLQEYIDRAESDYLYLHSELSEDERDKIIEAIKRYAIYDESISLDENIRNAVEVVDFVHEFAGRKNIYSVVEYLSVLESDKTLQEFLSDIDDMKRMIDELSQYGDKEIKTAGDLVEAYSEIIAEMERQKVQLTEQRKQITDMLAEYGLTESDLEDIPKLTEEKLKEAQDGLAQIDNGLKQINENMPKIESGLQEITDGKALIMSKLDDAKKQIVSAEKEIKENEKKLNDETIDRLDFGWSIADCLPKQ